MRFSGRARSLALAAVAAALALATGSSPALAATFTLNLSVPSTGTVGTAMAITASGNDPTDQGALYLESDALPTTLVSTCPSGYLNASSLASSTPNGQFISLAQPEVFDASGNFSNVNSFTPSAPGTYLICAYTGDYAGDTLAAASMSTRITAAAPQVRAPVNTTKPRVTRSGGTLRCSVGVWANAPVSYSYRWLVGVKVRNGARGRTLGPARKLRGHRVRCTVTASNSAGSASATSGAFTVH